MSKKLSYKGMLFKGTQEKIRLKTLKGKKGYKITKFQIMANAPGTSDYEFIAKITKVEDPSILGTVDFTDSKLMAVAYLKGRSSADYNDSTKNIIFDNEMTNQDIFINISDNDATGSDFCNYYIELEQVELSDIQATELTLRNIRQVTSVGST
jgi:hypothetical protein